MRAILCSKYQDKQQILEESNIIHRLEMLSVILENENSVLSVEQEINEKVKEQLDRNQREYVLREQIRVINAELNELGQPGRGSRKLPQKKYKNCI